MAKGAKKQSRKKDRQRKSSQNLRYKNERRHAKSHVTRLVRHLERQPTHEQAREALERYVIAAGGWMPRTRTPDRSRLRAA